ncbi:hypothetical protein GCM10010358_80260 [Streptomyces minutiscleroticus]|uniref:TCTP domain-containing protein n=1 Tax=Streptomyces minutiscleroticus TaxID=68238 RepID=A0A918U9L5_9ACTN|nr:translationally-controlled tumor protein [Streptomyces minutiscleroticus]GGY16525.1 hypothetical protein GCM10010358_80260 [Streptomyces minutiscleroticus]
MLLYTDTINGDELFSDAFPVKEAGAAYEVDCQMIQVKSGVDVDIAGDGQDEEPDEGASTANNVVVSFQLQQTSFDKKSYMTHIKGYMKALEAKLRDTDPARLNSFKEEAGALVKAILGDFEKYEFYTGQSMDPDGMVALLSYRADGTTPYFTFFKDGTKVQKL